MTAPLPSIPAWRAHAAPGQSLAAARSYDERKKSSAELVTPMLSRILRPQAAYRWLLPQLSSITPQFIETTLRGALAGSHVQAWELFDLMEDTWPELAACQQELKFAVLRKKVIFEPYREEDAEPTPDALEKMKVVSAALRKMRPDAAADENALPKVQFDLLDAWFKGVSLQEIDWHQVRCGNLGEIWGPRATFWVHPVCYAWDMEGRLGLRRELDGLMNRAGFGGQRPSAHTPLWNAATWQSRPTDVIPFPPHKFLVAIQKAKSGPALGGALLRPLAWWWCAANFSADWLMNLAQVFGLPFRWANYAQGTAQQTVDAICDMLENMGSAGWAAFPEGTTLELKEASKTGDASPQGDLLDRADRYARTLILGQTLSGNSGTGKGGGLAFGQQEGTVKDDRIEAAGDFVCAVINEQLIPSILELNYGDSGLDDAPVMTFLEDEDETELLTNYGTAVRAGAVTPCREDEVALRKRLKLPAMSRAVEREWRRQDGARAPITGGQTSTLKPDPEKTTEHTKGAEPKTEPDKNLDAAAARVADGKTFDAEAKRQFLAAIAPDMASLKKQLGAELEAIALLDDPALVAARLKALEERIARWERAYELSPPGVEEMQNILASAVVNGIQNRRDAETQRKK